MISNILVRQKPDSINEKNNKSFFHKSSIINKFKFQVRKKSKFNFFSLFPMILIMKIKKF